MNLQTKTEKFLDRKSSIKWLLFFAALMLLVMLGSRELWTQEWRWANISWNMIFSGDYFHPYLAGAPYYDKPLLSYWVMIAFSHLMGGLSTWSLRLPAALAGILAVFCTYRVGALLINKRAGFIAGWILLTTFYFIFWARTANTDMLNVAGIMLATMWYFQRRERPGILTYGVYFLILAVSALFKGLIAPVVSVLVILPDLFAKQQWKQHLRWQVLPAIIPAIIIYLIPFIWSSHAGGAHYSESGFTEVWQENVVRYFRPFDHEDPIYCYFIYLPLYMLPWTVFFIPALISLRKRWQTMTSGSRWTVWSTLLIFVFLTVSGSRRNYYVLPLVPFATLLTADWIAAGFASNAKRIRAAVMMGMASYLLLFTYYDIAVPLYYSNGGLSPFVQQVRAQAIALRPWAQWNIVFLDAESKTSLYLDPAKPIAMLGLPDATRVQRDKDRGTYSTQELLQLWPILTQHKADTILVTRKLYLEKFKPYLPNYKVIVASPGLGERLLKQDDSSDPVAFIPLN
jgi:4-amino-4-deoxy-L-arabinose transferase-like glycosyltransferase